LLTHLAQLVLHAVPDAAKIDRIHAIELFAAGIRGPTATRRREGRRALVLKLTVSGGRRERTPFAALLKICAGMTGLCALADKWPLRASCVSKKISAVQQLRQPPANWHGA
jgi:hypothetical protein